MPITFVYMLGTHLSYEQNFLNLNYEVKYSE